MCGVGHHAPSGPPWTSTMVGSGPSPAPAGEQIQTSIGAAVAGRLDEAHLDRRESRAARPTRWSTGSVSAGALAGVRPVDGRELHRPRAVGGQGGDRSVAGDGQGVGRGRRPRRRSSLASSGVGGSTGRPVVGVEPEAARVRPTAVADDGDDRARRRATHGPCRPETIQPVRSVSTQLPIGPVEVGREVDGRAAALSRRPGRAGCVGLTSSSGSVRDDADRRDPAAVGRVRPGGWPSRRAPGSRAARARLVRRRRRRPTQIVVRGSRSGSGPRSAVKAIVRPSGCQAMSLTPQSPLVTWRGVAAAARRRRSTGATSDRDGPPRPSASRSG